MGDPVNGAGSGAPSPTSGERAPRPLTVTVIGGGIVGLMCAYYLRRAGCQVSVLERGDAPGEGASYGNAGMIVPSHSLPLAAPGVLWQGIKWMTSPESPFYLRPRPSGSLIGWAYRFWRASSRERAENAAPVLLALNLASAAEYGRLDDELGGFGFEQRGLLMLSESASGFEHELALAAQANAWGLSAAGLPATAISLSELAERERGVRFEVKGAVYYPSDAHLDPGALMRRLTQELVELGVEIRYGTTVALSVVGGRVAVNDGGVPDWVVLAAGSWSGMLARQVGLRLPLEPGKGYSLSLAGPESPLTTPVILTEARVAITPLPGALRVGGTLELAGFDHGAGARRVKGIIDSAVRALPSLDRRALEATAAWHGFRPLTPDGLPYLGRSRRLRNLIVATGHAMMGVSLAPISGKLVAALATGGEATDLLASGLLEPERYS